MNSRERVIEVIEHRQADRMPVYGWVSANLSKEITDAFGSVAAFEDRYEFDLAHLFGGPCPYREADFQGLRERGNGAIEPAAMLDYALSDPNESSAYDDIRRQVAHHKTTCDAVKQRGGYIMGGLDVQTMIGFGNHDRLKREIERIIGMFAGGGMIFCTSHFVQSHCMIEELTLAYDTVYELERREGRR